MTRRRSLDADRDFWDNRSNVIKHPALSSILSSILASILALGLAVTVAGCQKSADLGRVQEESLVLVKVHVNVVDQLQRRADALLVRGRTVGTRPAASSQGIADAGKLLTDARARLDQLRALTVQAPATISTAVKTGNDEEVYKATDELIEQLDKGAVLVRADLDAVEQWLSIAEGRPAPAAAIPPAPAPSAGTAPASAVAPPAATP